MRAVSALAIVGALGCADAEPPATIAGATSMTTSDWLRVARRALLHDHCSAGAPFRSCSDTTREECETTIGHALRPCSADLRERVPDRISAGAEDERLRLELTGCLWHHAAFALGPERIDMRCLMTPR